MRWAPPARTHPRTHARTCRRHIALAAGCSPACWTSTARAPRCAHGRCRDRALSASLGCSRLAPLPCIQGKPQSVPRGAVLRGSFSIRGFFCIDGAWTMIWLGCVGRAGRRAGWCGWRRVRGRAPGALAVALVRAAALALHCRSAMGRMLPNAGRLGLAGKEGHGPEWVGTRYCTQGRWVAATLCAASPMIGRQGGTAQCQSTPGTAPASQHTPPHDVAAAAAAVGRPTAPGWPSYICPAVLTLLPVLPAYTTTPPASAKQQPLHPPRPPFDHRLTPPVTVFLMPPPPPTLPAGPPP